VAGAFHTTLMSPARVWLRKSLSNTPFSEPEIPVVANVDGRAHSAAADWPGLLSAQLCSPVRWRQSLETLAGMGATRFVEIGPGGVLTGLARRTVPDALASAVATPDDLDKLVNAIAGSDTLHSYAAAHQGEHLYTSERVVISPSAGVFEPVAGLAAPGPGGLSPQGADVVPGEGAPVAVGDLLGTVGAAEVRTPFAGIIVGFLAHPGERVAAGEPVAWLRVQADGA